MRAWDGRIGMRELARLPCTLTGTQSDTIVRIRQLVGV